MKFFLIIALFQVFVGCSENTTNNFIDPEAGLQWSETVADGMKMKDSADYCESLTENHNSDFFLPTVEQLWTLVIKCADFSVEDGCPAATNGKYSRFGDSGRFWSSSFKYIEDIISTKSPYPVPLYFDFDNVKEGYDGIYPDTIYKIRCVREYIVKGAEKKDQQCSFLPANSSWNTVGTITQTWNGSEWLPSTETQYNEEPSTKECRFICSEGYIEYDGSCVEAELADKWSKKSSSKMRSVQAFDYCENLDENGHTDWELPTISEIRNITINCPQIETGGTCGITDECLNKSNCWSDECNGCGIIVDKRYSKFEDVEAFYTVSPNTESWYGEWTIENDKELYLSDVWVLDFSLGRMYNDYGKNTNHVRCVRR